MLRRIMIVALYTNVGLFVVNSFVGNSVDLWLNVAAGALIYLWLKYV